jgi:Tol biopolymer transport system component
VSTYIGLARDSVNSWVMTMLDLYERFEAIDGIPTPDLSMLLEQKLAAESETRTSRLVVLRSPTSMPPNRRATLRKVLTIAAALGIAALGLVFAVRAFRAAPIHHDRLGFMRQGNEVLVLRTDRNHNNGRLFAVDVMTGEQRLLVGADDGSVSFGAWSPDGTMLLYEINYRYPGAGFYVRDASGRHVLGVGSYLHGSWTSGAAAWSPDGTRIALAGPVPDLDIEASRAPIALFVVDVGDWTPVEVPNTRMRGNAGPDSIGWSADRSWIAFEAGGQIHVVAQDGRRQWHREGWGPSWQRDGGHLAFAGPDGGVVIVNEDGTYPIRFDGSDFRWSPDGDQIAFFTMDYAARFDRVREVRVRSSADLSREWTIWRSPGGVPVTDGPVWSPDGYRIAFRDSHGRWRAFAVDGSDADVPADELPTVAALEVLAWH